MFVKLIPLIFSCSVFNYIKCQRISADTCHPNLITNFPFLTIWTRGSLMVKHIFWITDALIFHHIIHQQHSRLTLMMPFNQHLLAYTIRWWPKNPLPKNIFLFTTTGKCFWCEWFFCEIFVIAKIRGITFRIYPDDKVAIYFVILKIYLGHVCDVWLFFSEADESVVDRFGDDGWRTIWWMGTKWFDYGGLFFAYKNSNEFARVDWSWILISWSKLYTNYIELVCHWENSNWVFNLWM